MSATVLYDKAFRSYLLTKYTPAANTCLKAIAALKKDDQQSTRLNIWTLYLNITSILLVDTPFLGINMKLLGIQSVNSMEEVCRSIWKKVTEEGYESVGNTDSRLVFACVAMNIQLNQLSVARNIAEEWFASLSDEVMDHISADRDQDQITEGYNKVIELYVGRTLPRMHDFESANTFLDYNSVLTDSRKKALKSIIKQEQESVENKHQKKIQTDKELEEKKKEDERLLIEEAKRIEQEKLAQEKEKLAQEKEKLAEEAKKSSPEPEVDTTSRSMLVNQSPSPSPSSQQPPQQQKQKQQQTVIQKWMNQITTKGATSSGAILILIFALFALLRGQRGRLSMALQDLMNKLWQTIKMGTKVTYM